MLCKRLCFVGCKTALNSQQRGPRTFPYIPLATGQGFAENCAENYFHSIMAGELESVQSIGLTSIKSVLMNGILWTLSISWEFLLQPIS